MSDINNIVKLSQEKMLSDLNHGFNFIKVCPYCGLIWLKVLGSYGLSVCRNFPNNDQYIFVKNKIPQKYTFTITEQGLNYTFNKDAFNLDNPINKQYIDPSSQNQKKLGRGETFGWKFIPPLQGKQLKELIDPDLMDYFAQQGSNEELQKPQKYLYDQIEQMKNKNKVIKL